MNRDVPHSLNFDECEVVLDIEGFDNKLLDVFRLVLHSWKVLYLNDEEN